jgi:predicted HicB family RNase H-like nuclease
MKETDRYLKVVEWSEEDGCYVGRCPGLMLGGVHGKDEKAVYRELCEAAEEVVEIHLKDGRPLPPATANRSYSGRFVLRLPADLHEALAVRALIRGESLNGHVRRLLSKALGWTAIGEVRREPRGRAATGRRRRTDR